MSLNPLDYVYDWSAIASFFVASAALISSVIAYKAIKLQEATIELQKSNFDLQRQKVEEEFTVAWTNQVINWANKCCDVISCLESKAKYEVNSDKDAIANLLGSLSSLIDRGRLLQQSLRKEKTHKMLKINNLTATVDDGNKTILEALSLEVPAGEVHAIMGPNGARSPDRGMLIITHYQRLLDYIVPDRVHVLAGGKIAASGDADFAKKLEAEGYDAYVA